jgi:hypothetical protein
MSCLEIAFMKSDMAGFLPRAPEVEHRFLQIGADLAGEPRLSTGAFKSFLMAAGADHGSIGAFCFCGNIAASWRLLQIGPSLLRKVLRQRQQVGPLETLRNRRHQVVFARPGFEIAQFDEKITKLLAQITGTGEDCCTGTPFSPWQAAQTFVLSSMFCGCAAAECKANEISTSTENPKRTAHLTCRECWKARVARSHSRMPEQKLMREADSNRRFGCREASGGGALSNCANAIEGWPLLA